MRFFQKALLSLVFFSTFGFFAVDKAEAATGLNVTGYAWSSNIGWVSFNCSNDNSCNTYAPGPGVQGPTPYYLDANANWRISLLEYTDAIAMKNNGEMTQSEFDMVTAMYNYMSGSTRTGEYHSLTSGVDYGVHKAPDGSLCGNDACTVPGYAWSSNIGWIQFGGLSGFPTGGSTYAQNAQVVGSELRGWARALSADGNGWDGWISLRGPSLIHGVNMSGSSFTGYAWGSSVIGWLLFNVQSTGICANCGVTSSGDATLDVRSGSTSIVNNGAVPYGTTPTFHWTLTNIPSATCSVSKTVGGTPFTTVNGITSSGSVTGNSLTSSGLHTYSIDCTNPTISKQVSFTVAPMPAGFSIGGTETAKIQFVASGSADSQIKNIFVTPVGGYSNPVTISITGYPTPPSGTTFTYSLGGSAFSASPAPVVLTSPYNVGTTIQVRVSKPITTQYTVTLTATGAGATNATKNIIVDPTSFDPIFRDE